MADKADARLLGWAILVDSPVAGLIEHTHLEITIQVGSNTLRLLTSLTGNLVPGPNGESQTDPVVVGAVRQGSFESLFRQCSSDGPEPLLRYLRACGIVVLAWISTAQV